MDLSKKNSLSICSWNLENLEIVAREMVVFEIAAKEIAAMEMVAMEIVDSIVVII